MMGQHQTRKLSSMITRRKVRDYAFRVQLSCTVLDTQEVLEFTPTRGDRCFKVLNTIQGQTPMDTYKEIR